MSDTCVAPSEALSALFEDWSRAEESSENQVWDLLGPLEEAFSRLDDLAAQLAEADQTEAAVREEAEQRIQSAEELRAKLEHDLQLARERVTDLEASLQQRTEELLEAQNDNNELAAQLQESHSGLAEGGSAGSDGSIDAAPQDGANPAGESSEPAEGLNGVAARFAQLRRS